MGIEGTEKGRRAAYQDDAATRASIEAFSELNDIANRANSDGKSGLNRREERTFFDKAKDAGFSAKDAREFARTYDRDRGTVDRESMVKWTQGYNYRNNQSPYGLSETELTYAEDTHGTGPASTRAQIAREKAAERAEELKAQRAAAAEGTYDEESEEEAPTTSNVTTPRRPSTAPTYSNPAYEDKYAADSYANPYASDPYAEASQYSNNGNGGWWSRNERWAGPVGGLVFGLLGGFWAGRSGRNEYGWQQYTNGYNTGYQNGQQIDPWYGSWNTGRRNNNYNQYDNCWWNRYG